MSVSTRLLADALRLLVVTSVVPSVVHAADAPAASSRTAIDGVAAVVERRVITTSEVDAEARLALLEKAGADVAAGHLDAQLEKAVLDSMVAQELLALEARRTGVAVREIDIDKSVAAVRAHFDDADAARTFFTRFGIDEELLRGRARRDLAAGALLEKTFADVKVSDDEADAYLTEHKDLVDRAMAKRALDKARRDARFAALMKRLAAHVEVRVVWHP